MRTLRVEHDGYHVANRDQMNEVLAGFAKAWKTGTYVTLTWWLAYLETAK